VIPNFVCVEKMNFEISESFALKHAPNGEKILVHISNFRAVKRVEDVIRMFALILEKMPAKLLLIGDGPDRSKVEQLCREMNTCDHVIMLGKLKNPTEALGVADLFVLPSESESFGLAALEAMAARVPVISTNTGGIPEINRHGVTGMMSNVGDYEDMAKHAIYLLEDEDRLAKFKANAFKRAMQFDIEKILPIYEELYLSVLKKDSAEA
ncbi:MAG: N-acetyl-alpha-D-glucosaminyl L-malate synthase BshA, partial [Gammaproteobacteria bacterium]